jgi:hypothetical protein
MLKQSLVAVGGLGLGLWSVYAPRVEAVVPAGRLEATAVAQDRGGDGQAHDVELKACGPREKEAKFDADTDKKNHPTPEPDAGSALVYVLRPTMMGNRIQTTLAVDGEWKGVNRGNNYFFFNLAPGEHYVCSKAENRSVLTLQVEAGRTYYLQQHIEMGFMKSRNKIDIMTEDEGKKKLKDVDLSTWQLK